MLFGLFWGDWTVLVLIPAMIFAFWAQINVQTTFSRFKQVRNRRGLTAADVARRILDANGLNYVQIQRVSGELTDHYDPRAQVVRLSGRTCVCLTACMIPPRSRRSASRRTRWGTPASTRRTTSPCASGAPSSP